MKRCVSVFMSALLNMLMGVLIAGLIFTPSVLAKTKAPAKAPPEIQWREKTNFRWENVNADPYRGEYLTPLLKCGIPEAVARRLIARITARQKDDIAFISKAEGVWSTWEGVAENDFRTKLEMVCTVFGSGPTKTVALGVTPDFSGTEQADLFIERDEAGEIYVVAMPRCGNPSVLKAPHIPLPPTIPPGRPPKAPPKQPPYQPPAAPPVVTLPPKVEKWIWGADAFIGLGQVLHPGVKPTNFAVGEVAFYPYGWDGETSRQFVGVGGQFGWCKGQTEDSFAFECFRWGGGLAYKYIHWGDWDASVKLLIGELFERGSGFQKQYESERRFLIFGPAISLNRYGGDIPKTQAFATMAWPIDSWGKHSWQGKQIQDTKALERLDWFYSLGVRQYLLSKGLFDGWVLPYIEIGCTGTPPVAESCRLQIGISDKYEIGFAAVGPSIDRYTGRVSFLWSVGVDVARAVEVIRDEHRRGEMEAELRRSLRDWDPKTGSFGLRFELPATVIEHPTKPQPDERR